MSNESKLSNLSDTEKSIKDEHGPHEKDAANNSENKDDKEKTSESGNK